MHEVILKEHGQHYAQQQILKENKKQVNVPTMGEWMHFLNYTEIKFKFSSVQITKLQLNKFFDKTKFAKINQVEKQEIEEGTWTYLTDQTCIV